MLSCPWSSLSVRDRWLCVLYGIAGALIPCSITVWVIYLSEVL